MVIENAVSAEEIKVDAKKMHISTTDVAIDIIGMHKWYGEFHVLKDINLKVMRGERIVICGPSGSGKSTMIRCINRLEEHRRQIGRLATETRFFQFATGGALVPQPRLTMGLRRSPWLSSGLLETLRRRLKGFRHSHMRCRRSSGHGQRLEG